ncbi:hypothetical protein [Candidatus Nanosyncoccus alces]|uniref:Uncharacterized protein n=1 Tax=Candidatus Nanosyncoccus alces TaxID=2171997 RepID=A0ABY0FKU3_9BACT|nr:hypothetical protein [Candidatus Nanosyncoccus alces]RYC74370.1 hypothetical protein G3RUM_00521 [Candidatus Nanosyncoccus alces]
MKNISLRELETLTTTRVVCDRFATRKGRYITKYRYLEVLEQTMYALDDILVDRGLNKDFWARVRGKRLYLFYLPLNRIAIEVGIVTDEAEDGFRKRFEMQFVGYRGKFPPETIADLIEILEESSRKYQERRSYDRNHQRKIR